MTGFLRAGRLARLAPDDLTVAQADRLSFPAPGRVERFTHDLEARGASRALLRAHRGWIALYCVAGLGVVALGPAVPALVARLADRLRTGGVTLTLAGVVVGTVTLAAALRWLTTWLVRALLYQMTTLLKLAIFARLQRVDPARTGRSVSTYLVTAPQQVAQIAFVAEFAVNTALALALTGYLAVAFGWVGLVVAALVGVLVAGWQRLVRAETRAMHGYLEHGHQRVTLVDTVTRHWASIARQHWTRPVLTAAERARDGQFTALRAAARPAAVLAALAGGGTALVCLIAVVLAGDLGAGLALLLVVQLLVAAVRENMSTYAAVAWAATMTADVETLFRDAPLLEPSGPPPRPGERILVLGDPAAVRAYLDDLPGRVAVVARNEPELDGTLRDNALLWSVSEDSLRDMPHVVSEDSLRVASPGVSEDSHRGVPPVVSEDSHREVPRKVSEHSHREVPRKVSEHSHREVPWSRPRAWCNSRPSLIRVG
ncbi:hypothetical protein [Paractinoplanes lichenicola]|uniref:ABC transmembrane type-1 domain-containing protein n=1 Tax=Paractinoplanes lichenicola TaxID=2802976 RepID=A0ABS1W2T4_9ACTN|nr:hypothetical protein [Actinoplanes lichenicola]MBL7261025.1 hypothetical protein [Actinoplanes lichenicola]